MSRPRLRDRKKSATVRPTAVASATITVINANNNGTVNGATVEIVGAKLRAGAPTVTNDDGVLRTGPFLPGKYVVKVSKKGFGPFTPPIVREGELSEVVDFLPNDQLPTNQNEITFRMGIPNPKVIITVEEVTLLGDILPIAGADVDVIGTSKGQTDAFGVFSSTELPFGKVGITVSKAGFTPETQDGPGWFQQIEVLKGSTVDGKLPDFTLTVRMVSLAGPKNLPPVHPKPLALWLNGGPSKVDPDARLDPPSATDTVKGQAGWDFAADLTTNSFQKVASALANGTFEVPDDLGGGTVGPNQLRRLAILAHGAAGVMDVDQLDSTSAFGTVVPTRATSLTVDSFAKFAPALDDIGKCLMRGARVYLMACELAEKQGEDLLRLISQRWPTVQVVAIRTLAAIPVTLGKRPAGGQFPGLRDTNNHNLAQNPREAKEFEVAATCNDLKRLPWFSETSTHATVFIDGNLIRRGAEAV